MKVIKSYQEKFGLKVFDSVDEIEMNPMMEFERIDSELKDNQEWKKLLRIEFYEFGVSNIHDYVNDSSIEHLNSIIEIGKELLGEEMIDEEFIFNASNDRIKLWKSMDKDDRISFLMTEFGLPKHDVLAIYSDNIKDLPLLMKDYFYDKDDDMDNIAKFWQ